MARKMMWGEYYKLRSEIKECVHKKLNEVIERLKTIFMKTGKSFGHLLAGLQWVIIRVLPLRRTLGSCITSTKGKFA